MAKILVALDTVDEGFENICKNHQVIRPPKGYDFTREEVCQLISDCDVLCSVFDMPIDKEVIDKGKKLKLIANYAVGYNNIDIEYAKEKGIIVTNTPNAVIQPTAELAFALIIDCARRVSELDRMMREMNPYKQISRLEKLGIDLNGKTIGIIGYGNIGGALSKMCQAFGMNVLYYKRKRLDVELEKDANIKYISSIDEILPLCDIVSVHTPYSKDTHHLINSKRLQSMKSTAILINTSRGPVVDEAALIKALKNKTIWAAGLDVFENKDIPIKELMELDNVVMTPHVGTQTYDARVAMLKEMLDNVEKVLSGKDTPARIV